MESLRLDESGQIDHLDELFPCECRECCSAKSQLNGSALQADARWGVVGIPLKSYRRGSKRVLPLRFTRERRPVVRGWHRLFQERLEEIEADAQAKRDLLTLFGPPSRSVHHPEKVRLDPTHARETEIRSPELLMLDRV